jgi:hypothetical protein
MKVVIVKKKVTELRLIINILHADVGREGESGGDREARQDNHSQLYHQPSSKYKS